MKAGGAKTQAPAKQPSPSPLRAQVASSAPLSALSSKQNRTLATALSTFNTSLRILRIAAVLCFLQAGPSARGGVSKQRGKLSPACECLVLPPLQSMSALRSVASAAKKLVQVQHASIAVPHNVQVPLHASLWQLKPTA